MIDVGAGAAGALGNAVLGDPQPAQSALELRSWFGYVRCHGDATLSNAVGLVNKKNVTEPMGARLRRDREAAGLGVRDLARLADVDPSYISQIEHGKRQPHPRTLAAIKRALARAGTPSASSESPHDAGVAMPEQIAQNPKEVKELAEVFAKLARLKVEKPEVYKAILTFLDDTRVKGPTPTVLFRLVPS